MSIIQIKGANVALTHKPLLICADDFAQNKAVCDGILQLVEHSRINAVSCLVNTALWFKASQHLLRVKPQPLVGLHFNLTTSQALSPAWRNKLGHSLPSLSKLIAMAYSKQLDVKLVTAELDAQLDLFMQCMKTKPDFVDGHQHVHQLPIIRDALINCYQRHQLTGFIRNTSNGLLDWLTVSGLPKQALISLLGGLTFKKMLTKQRIDFNPSFAGIYNFAKAKHYPLYFKRFLANSSSNGLIMCHPGAYSTDSCDPLSGSRHHELNYLLSNDFLDDLVHNAFQLSHK